MRASLAVSAGSLHWLCAERSGLNDSAGEGRRRRAGDRESRQMQGAGSRETEGRRPRLREIVQKEGNQRLKRRKKKYRRRPFQEMDRQTEPRRWRSRLSLQPGRNCPLTLSWATGVQPTDLWGRGVPDLQENLPQGLSWETPVHQPEDLHQTSSPAC